MGRVTLHRWVDQHVLAAVVGTLGSPVGEENEWRERGVGVGDGGLQRERAPSGFQAQLLASAEDDAAPTQKPPRRRLMSLFFSGMFGCTFKHDYLNPLSSQQIRFAFYSVNNVNEAKLSLMNSLNFPFSWTSVPNHEEQLPHGSFLSRRS